MIKPNKVVAHGRMLIWRLRRREMIDWLIHQKQSTPKKASKVVDGFLEKLWQHILKETGGLE